MATTGSRITMTDQEFARLRDVIYKRSGIHFPDNKKYILESRLGHRLHELDLENFDQYIAFLTMGPYQVDEFQEMFNRITINETSFFRNEAQLQVFERQILPELLEARKDLKRIRIWSAACSTGEEPYTLAILVHRSLGVRLADWRIEILGTDISERALKVANGGIYTNYAMRSTSELIKRRYFTEENGQFRLSDEIREMVSFELHNLKDSMAAKRHGTWDIIFCRNVLIYFDDQMKRLVTNTFADVLAKDGTLFIGHSENIRDVSDAFEQLPIPQGFCYRHASCAGALSGGASR
ncbi:MAG: protein-glutamate O-methyltransferase CheR [Planctomycetota bacterium]|nr:MAG: protein-glutamate O-methyltransferase CheR [Planctomycetota bacterium]